MKEILRFTYNDKLLCLLIENEELKYGKIIDNKVIFTLTEKEKNIIRRVFVKVLPTGSTIDLGYFAYNEKSFKHHMDKTNGLHLFYEEKDNQLIVPDSNNLKILNLMFNNQNEFVNSHDGLSIEDIKYYKRIVQYGKQFIIVFISTVACLSLYTYMGPDAKLPFLDNNIAYTENYNNLDAITKINKIISTINNNPNLTLEEKEFFLSAPEFIEDSINYFRYDKVIEHLEKLNVEYIAGPSLDGSAASFVYAGPKKGTLKVYNSTSFADAPKWAMSHEFVHAFTSYENYIYGKGFYEIINTIINNEYYGVKNNVERKEIYDTGYSWIRAYAYIIISTLEETDLRAYHATGNPEIIVNALNEIIPDKDKAIKLLTYFDFLVDNIAYRTDLSQVYVPDFIRKVFGETRNNLNELCKEYYKAKFGIEIEEDLYLQYWADREMLFQSVANIYNLNASAIRFLPEYTKVKKYKTFFTSTEDNNMVVMICDTVGFDRQFCTKEELLAKGYTEEEINQIYIRDDGKYDLCIYYPKKYTDCPLGDNQNKIERTIS